MIRELLHPPTICSEQQQIQHQHKGIHHLPSDLGEKLGAARAFGQISASMEETRAIDEGYWDCSVCTYKNSPEAFKCDMCDVRKGTSTGLNLLALSSWVTWASDRQALWTSFRLCRVTELFC